MKIRTQVKDPHTQVQLGLFFLVAGALSLHFAARVMSKDLADGVSGLFYGLAIGLMLLGGSRGGLRKPRR